MMSIGFIGLGNIGKPMAMKWISKDEPLLVYDVVPQAVADLVAAGATAVATPAEMARQSRIIGLCVRDDKDVEQLLYGAGGILENAKPDTIVAIHSTVHYDSIIRWNQEGRAKSIHVIDAAVTRALVPVTFCYMVGGDAALVERLKPVLLAGDNSLVHAGPVGAAIQLKLCNNMMTYAAFVAMHEATRLAEACGIDPDLLNQVGKANGVVTQQMKGFFAGRNQVAKAGEEALYKAFGPVAKLGTKDLDAALQRAKQVNAKLPGAQKNRELIEDVILNRY
jgi:3-hydroxyisobutyrate dehydrogenase-like beta-hydroxyacid dehydrogenase